MSILDIVALNGSLKELYKGQKTASLLYDGRPLMAKLKKYTSFVGETYPLPVMSSTGAGSNSYASAFNNQTPGQYKKFQLTRAYNYGIGSISREAVMAGASDVGAFINAKSFEIDNKIRQVANEMSLALFRSGTGTLGVVTSITTGVIVLTNAADSRNFVINQALQAAATDGGTPRAAGGFVIVISPDAGTITVSATLGGAAGTPASWAAADFILPAGNSNAGALGLAAWFPVVAPTSTLYLGIDRSTNPTLLAGTRYVAPNGEAVQDTLTKAATQLSMNSSTGTADLIVMNPVSWQALVQEMGSKVQVVRQSVGMKQDGEDVVIGFSAFQIATALGILDVVSDRSCPPLISYILDTSVLEVASLGEAPELQDSNGQMLSIVGTDAYQYTISAYWNLACHNTSACAVVQTSI